MTTKTNRTAKEKVSTKTPKAKYLTTSNHKFRHVVLHNCLDELVADYILHTKMSLSSSIMELIKWSFTQTTDPTPDQH